MGLLIPTYTVPNFGVTLTGAYVALAKNTVVLHPDAAARGTYTLLSTYGIWASKDARDQGASALSNVGLSLTYEASDGVQMQSLYAAMYAAVKQRFPDGVDVLELPAAEEAAGAPASEPMAAAVESDSA